MTTQEIQRDFNSTEGPDIPVAGLMLGLSLEGFRGYAQRIRPMVAPLPSLEDDFEHMLMGCFTEAGELVNAIKVFAAYGRPLDMLNICEEAGDTVWYIINAVVMCGWDLAALYETLCRLSPQNEYEERPPLRMMLRAIYAAAGCLHELTPESLAAVQPEDYGEHPLTLLLLLVMGFVLAWGDGRTLERVMTINLAKLMLKRYKKGVFNQGEALFRDVADERAAMLQAYNGGLSIDGFPVVG